MDERILNHEGEFAFKELTEVLGRDFQGQSFISEGFIFNLCTSGSMKIPEKLHFPNVSSFVRFFRTHIGVSPLRYRRMKEE